jgi:hypothetical protein
VEYETRSSQQPELGNKWFSQSSDVSNHIPSV